MPSITLHPTPAPTTAPNTTTNPLPPLLHTPLGLAILEIQGSLNIPAATSTSETSLQIGSLSFPLLAASGDNGASEGAWMKKVWLYIGQNQRLTGDVRKLGKPVGLVRRRAGGEGEAGEELEIMEIVRWKVFFWGEAGVCLREGCGRFKHGCCDFLEDMMGMQDGCSSQCGVEWGEFTLRRLNLL